MASLDFSRPAAAVRRPRQDTLTTFAAVFGVIAVLYFGRDLLVPLAIALLFSFLLATPVIWLHRHGMPRVLAVGIVVSLALVAVAAFAAVVAFQVVDLASNLPSYERNLQSKIQTVRATLEGEGILRRATDVLTDLGKDLANPEATAPTAVAAPELPEPVPVQVLPPAPEPLAIAMAFLGPLIGPVTTGGVVIVFVIFILLEREDLRDRFIRLVGARDLNRTTHALGDAGERVSRYLVTQLVINVLYGVPVGVGLWLIGVPNPVLWGMLALGLRFVPYVGPIMAAVFPLLLSLAVDPGWGTVIATAGLFVALELISNNFIEPWLYGSRTGLSPIAIIVSAIFWSWLWGPVGLLLSTPLSVCLVSFAQYMPRLEFLSVLLGAERALAPEERLYQRLLAGDADEATELAEAFIKDNGLVAFYDRVGIPMLAIAERDRQRGFLDGTQIERIASGSATVVDNLTGSDTAATAVPEDAPLLLCAGGRGALDDVAALMLAHVVERAGARVRRASADELRTGNLGQLPWDQTAMICLSYVDSAALSHSRYLVRRIRRQGRNSKILLGLWTLDPAQAKKANVIETTQVEAVATTLADGLDQLAKELRLPLPPAADSGTVPAAEASASVVGAKATS